MTAHESLYNIAEVAVALAALLFALLPVALHHYRLDQPGVWSISSLLLGTYFAAARAPTTPVCSTSS